jgi:predicted HicB family RNase H-like nuclease
MFEARSTAPPSRRTIDPQALTTRVPASLRRRLVLYCVEHDVQVQDFVREALEEALRKKKRR